MADILVVDDERDVVTLMRFLLERDGHSVRAAYDGSVALGALGVEPADESAAVPDLILLDVMMPVMDGYTFCRRIASEPKLRGVPVVVLSAKSQVGDAFEASGNVAAYLTKPFEPQRLRDMIRSVLDGPAGEA